MYESLSLFQDCVWMLSSNPHELYASIRIQTPSPASIHSCGFVNF